MRDFILDDSRIANIPNYSDANDDESKSVVVNINNPPFEFPREFTEQLKTYLEKNTRDEMTYEQLMAVIKSIPAPQVTVHVPEQPTPIVNMGEVNVNVPEQKPADIIVNVPEQAAPVVNMPEVKVNLPEMKPADVIVNVPQQAAPIINIPEQKTPEVTVNVPTQIVPEVKLNIPNIVFPELPAPIVNVTMPEQKNDIIVNVPEQKTPIINVTVPEPSLRNKRVVRDAQGRIKGIEEE